MQILQKIGEIMAFVGVFGCAFLADIISGYSKAERTGQVKYADTPQKRKKKWLLVLLFLVIAAVGTALALLLPGAETQNL